MPVRKSDATWNGTLKEGSGTMAFGSGAFEGQYSFMSRFEEGEGTNPEELIGAAHAGCFSMAFASELEKAGYDPERVSTTASVYLEDGTITRVVLYTEVEVPDIDEETFLEIGTLAKETCPVSRALAGPEIELEATLHSS